MKKQVFVILVLFFSFSIFAMNNTPPELYLTHFVKKYIYPLQDKPIIEEAQQLTDAYHRQGGKIIFIDSPMLGWLIQGMPDTHYYETVGRVKNKISSPRVAVAGGYIGMCLSRTVISIIREYFKRTVLNIFSKPKRSLIIDLPMFAIFGAQVHSYYHYKTTHPTLLNHWEMWSRRERKTISLTEDQIKKYSINTTYDFLEQLESLEFEQLEQYSVRVYFDGILQGTFGDGKLELQFNYWTLADTLLADTFSNP